MSDTPPPSNQPPPYPGQEPYQPQSQQHQPPVPQPGQMGPGWMAPPKHPQSTTILVLGILGLVLCQVLAPVAWIMGSKALTEFDAQPNQWTGRSEINAGRILGIVGTVFLGLLIVFFVLYFIFIVIFFGVLFSNPEFLDEMDSASTALVSLLN